MFDSLQDLDCGALVAEVESLYRQESMLVAQRMAAVAALLRSRRAAAGRVEDRREYAGIDGFDQTAAEVAAAMNLSVRAANRVVEQAQTLDSRLPLVAALLSQGLTDWATVQVVIGRTQLVVDEQLIAALDESLAARIGAWAGWTRQRISNAVDAEVHRLDADAVRDRREVAENDRHVGIKASAHGMARIFGSVAATVAAAFDRRLSDLAKQVCGSDPRTLDQRRADALTALTTGTALACGCGQPCCPNTTGNAAAGGARVVINVVASADTVYGTSGRPGYLAGFGVIDAGQVRDLVATAAVHVINPVTSPVDALRYQPTAALQRAVRCRDLTCRFPGCSRPAMACDVDHSRPFNHQDPAAGGLTVFENLKCLCRLHHRLKTFGGWRDTQLADGTIVWTSPAGRTYQTSPAGADLFPQAANPPCGPPPPNRRSRSQQRASRITQARKHNREQRPVNAHLRWLQQAREEEIADRQFRNHMRDMLFVFKGTPSTSPFCPWVNDPRETEDLPIDWKPDQPKPDPLPDDPPF